MNRKALLIAATGLFSTAISVNASGHQTINSGHHYNGGGYTTDLAIGYNSRAYYGGPDGWYGSVFVGSAGPLYGNGHGHGSKHHDRHGKYKHDRRHHRSKHDRYCDHGRDRRHH